MAEQGDKKQRRSSQKAIFMGHGRAVLIIQGFDNWKDFLKRDGRDLTIEEILDIEHAASYDNFSVDGKIRIEWPEVTVLFNMDLFLGRKKGSRERPMILTGTQNFATIVHPFAVDKSWFKGLDNKDIKKCEGYEWVFEQIKDNFFYKGHIRKGKEIFVTFEFGPNRRHHQYQGD